MIRFKHGVTCSADKLVITNSKSLICCGKCCANTQTRLDVVDMLGVGAEAGTTGSDSILTPCAGCCIAVCWRAGPCGTDTVVIMAAVTITGCLEGTINVIYAIPVMAMTAVT